MKVIVVTGRAGIESWPARIFREVDAVQANMFVEITTGLAHACRDNLKEFRQSDLYEEMTPEEQASCEKIITGALDAMDSFAAGTNLSLPVIYTQATVALHD